MINKTVSLMAFALVFLFAKSSFADAVGISSFGAPSVSTTQFNSLGSNNVSYESSPYTLGIATYSSTSSINVWGTYYGDFYQDCIGGCMTNNGSQDLSVTLNQSYGEVGLYVGQATGYDLLVSFYSGATLLGTEEAKNSDPNGGLTFEGWSSAGGVDSVQINEVGYDYFDVAAASIYTGAYRAPSATPEPGTLLLVATGALGAFTRRVRGFVKKP